MFPASVAATTHVVLLMMTFCIHTTGLSLNMPTTGPREIQYITEQIPAVVDEWWNLVANGETMISVNHLDDFFARYETDGGETLRLAEDDFIGGDDSWTKDFEAQGMTEEYSRAYFRSLDVQLDAFASPILTWEDLDLMIAIIEDYTNSGAPDGFVTKADFTSGNNEVILRSVPFSLMFVRYNKGETPLEVYENLNRTEFIDIFNEIDVDSNGTLSESDFALFWEAGQYGPDTDGRLLFDKLDYAAKGALSPSDWDDLFLHLDCREGPDGGIDIEEFFQLDLILHGLKEYPAGDCMLTRLP